MHLLSHARGVFELRNFMIYSSGIFQVYNTYLSTAVNKTYKRFVEIIHPSVEIFV